MLGCRDAQLVSFPPFRAAGNASVSESDSHTDSKKASHENCCLPCARCQQSRGCASAFFELQQKTQRERLHLHAILPLTVTLPATHGHSLIRPFNSVVFPDPRKPVIIVTGMGASPEAWFAESAIVKPTKLAHSLA